MPGKLFLVATPIGNLGDISQRAAQTLETVDFIAAEDTRVSVKILNNLGIKKPMVSYHEHNRAASGQRILQRLISGETCALVTDAGTPVISDPGSDLVSLCAEAGVEVTSIPGPCAAISGLILSGLPSGRFTFEGFLSTTKKNRLQHLDELKKEKRTMIFYEAPHKLIPTLRDMLSAWGDRRISLCRELTKLHEEVSRTTLAQACDYFENNAPRGEYVLVIEGAPEESDEGVSLEAALEKVFELRDGGMKLRDAVKFVSSETGIPKNQLYDAAVKAE